MRSGRRDDPGGASAGLSRPRSARASSRAPLVATGVVVALVAAGALHVTLAERQWPRRAESAVQQTLAAVESRASSLVGRLQGEADAVAAWPDTAAALRGDRAALVRLFQALEARTGRGEDRVSLAIHPLPDGAIVAWSGRVLDAAGLAGLAAGRRDVFVLGGTITTTLVASSPITGPGEPRGFVTASRAVAIRRNVRNQYLADHDVLAADDPGLDFRYVDARAQSDGPRPFAPPRGTVFRDAILRAPDGGVLAAVRAIAPPLDQERKRLETRYRSAAAVAASLALLTWAWSGAGAGGARLLRWAMAVIAARTALLAAGPAFPLVSADLLSPDTFASPLLGPLLRSAFDLLLTAGAAAALAFLALRATTLATPAPSRAGLLAAGLLALPVIAGGFFLVADTVANSSIDLTAMPLLPRSPAHLAVQVALALVFAATALASAAVVSLGGPLPAGRAARLAVGLGLAVAAGLAWWAWPRHPLGFPPVPALLLWAGAVVLGLRARRIAPRLATAEAAQITAATLIAVAAVTAILYPTLVHLGQNALRAQIERSHAPLVLQQPEWRAFVLQAAQARIDGMRLLEEAPPGIYYPGVEELAFAIWSATDLAAYGFSSAVEVQDPSGAVISRFALNLPFLAVPERRWPGTEAWAVSREPVGLASTETMVLHAQRLLTYHGEPHGAVHVYVGEDFSSLPFVQWSDPYAVLYRSAARGGVPERPVNLVVWDAHRDVAFSSLERPPALDPVLAAAASNLSRGQAGLWSRLEVDEVPHDAYLFAANGLVYALAYRRQAPDRYAADLVEAVSGLALLAAALLFVVLFARSLLGRSTVSLGSLRAMVARRFALRLFVAFTLVAFVPAAVLQVVVSGFVTNRLRREAEDQALDRAAVAKKAVEDYAFFQREETPSAEPVTDAALVWLASVVKNDLDVFVRGRLQASSKRELYASGLLAPRVSAAVYRAVVLEGQPAVVETERIGGFSYLVASVPVHVGGPEHAVLSMPLALRQREVQATVDDLDRSIRLASVLFLALAAILAQSMSRRISEPIRDLTRATRRVAEGDLEAQVEARSQDELRALVESFNQMARDLRRQRRDLERSNRLAAWAEMARQVAHEVKNPLTPIQLSTEHLRRVWADRPHDFDATLKTCTDTILKQVRTLREMVTEFSAFARPPAPDLEHQDLRAVLEDAVRPYRPGLPPGVELVLEMETVPPVRADRRLLERAVVNLLENALQAVGDGGRITVRLRGRSAPDRVEVEVEDTGPGIPAEMRDRIFEPFFSTKTTGSGLGLALVKKIAEDHDGGVTLASAPGQPTRAILWVPVSE